MDEHLKMIYTQYFKQNERDFIKLIELVGNHGVETVDNAIKIVEKACPTNVSIDKIEFICVRNDDSKVIYLENYNDDIMKNSINTLNEFNNLLNP